ncbi:MAG: efflux RND transporter periplasmic adaptor subunit [Pseudomonadota bacterium]
MQRKTPRKSPASTKSQAPSRTRRFLSTVAGLFGLLAAGSLALGAMALGTSTLHERAAARPPIDAPPPLTVRTDTARMLDHFSTVERYAGRFEPARSSALAFERGGTVVEILAEEGDRVEQGQVIARLDMALLDARTAELEARRDALEAQAELARLTTDRKLALKERGFATGEDHDTARLSLARFNASMKEVDAALMSVEIDRQKSVLIAPYAGTVGARRLDEGSIVEAGLPLIDLIESGRPQIRVGLPQDRTIALRIGSAYPIRFGETALTARLIALRPDIDPATRTAIALFDLVDAPSVPFGATADLELEIREDAPGMWLPRSSLRAGTRGLWTVLTVSDAPEGPTVGVESVEILTVRDDQAYVRGTISDGARIIVDGNHRVVPGMTVQPITAGEGA